MSSDLQMSVDFIFESASVIGPQKPLRAPKPPKPISMAPEVYTEVRASLERQQQALRDKIQARRFEIKRLAKEQALQKRQLGALGDLIHAMTPLKPKGKP